MITAITRTGEVSEEEFWEAVEKRLRDNYEDVERRMERREWQLRFASQPDYKASEKLQRYEAHLSRQFYKALHELQGLQLARHVMRASAPVAVEIDIDSAT